MEKPLLVIYMAGHLEDKHKCFYHGDELGIDNRLDSFALPPQVNHLSDFPLDLDKEAVYGYAANCFRASISTFHPFHFLLSYACHILVHIQTEALPPCGNIFVQRRYISFV